MITGNRAQRVFPHAIPSRYNSDKVLENALKVTTGLISGNSMSTNREPKKNSIRQQ